MSIKMPRRKFIIPNQAKASRHVKSLRDLALDTYELGDVKTADKITEAATQLEAMQAEIDRLRGAMIRSGRAAGCFLADNVTTDFLMLVPDEIEAKLASLENSRKGG